MTNRFFDPYKMTEDTQSEVVAKPCCDCLGRMQPTEIDSGGLCRFCGYVVKWERFEVGAVDQWGRQRRERAASNVPKEFVTFPLRLKDFEI